MFSSAPARQRSSRLGRLVRIHRARAVPPAILATIPTTITMAVWRAASRAVSVAASRAVSVAVSRAVSVAVSRAVSVAVTTAALALAVGLLVGGCHRDRGESPEERVVVVYTSVDRVFSEPVIQSCERSSGLRVRAVYDTEETKSTGLVNRLLAEAGQPQADVFWSGDPVRPLLLARHGLVETYRSPAASNIPSQFRAADGTWAGFAARARVLLVNTKRLGDAEPPRSIRDLTNPRWRGKAAMANPLFGTTTMHVAALFDAWGDEEARRFLEAVRANGVRVASSNGEVKRLVVEGEVTFGLTDTDDAFEAKRSGAPVSIVYPDQDGMGTLFMPTSVVLIKGGPHGEAGRRMIDCLLGPDVERQMAESAAHMPLRAGIQTPAGVPRASELRVMTVDFGHLAQTMERIEPWLRQWVGL